MMRTSCTWRKSLQVTLKVQSASMWLTSVGRISMPASLNAAETDWSARPTASGNDAAKAEFIKDPPAFWPGRNLSVTGAGLCLSEAIPRTHGRRDRTAQSGCAA